MMILSWLARLPPHLAIRKNKCCSNTNILADTQEHRQTHAFGDTPKPRHTAFPDLAAAQQRKRERKKDRGEREGMGGLFLFQMYGPVLYL